MMLASTTFEQRSIEAHVASLFVGFCIDAVEYLIPTALREEDRFVKGYGFEHAEAGVMLRNQVGERRSIRWSQRGFDDGLWIGESAPGLSGDWVADVRPKPAKSWAEFRGSSVRSVAFAWQSLVSARFSIWSMRLDFDGQSVAISLGERNPGSTSPTFIPDCVVVIFDESVGRSYRPPASHSSAWAEQGPASTLQ